MPDLHFLVWFLQLSVVYSITEKIIASLLDFMLLYKIEVALKIRTGR